VVLVTSLNFCIDARAAADLSLHLFKSQCSLFRNKDAIKLSTKLLGVKVKLVDAHAQHKRLHLENKQHRQKKISESPSAVACPAKKIHRN